MNLEWFLFEFAGLFYLKAGVVLAAGLAAALVFRNHSASTRYWTWNTTLALLVLVVPLSFLLPGWEASLFAPASLPPAERMTFAGAGIAASTVNDLLNSELFQANHDLSAWEMIWGGLLAVWVVGAVVLLSKLGADLLGLWLTSRDGDEAPAEWLPLIEQMRQRAECRLPVKVRLSERIGSPLIWGFVRPTVLLPATAAGWTAERLRMVLLHELLHAARFDHTMMILAQLVRCVYWGNPLTWIAVHRHSIERELSCDERVIDCGNDRVEYAEELLAITRDLRSEVRYASVAMTQQYGLKSRITTILADHVDLRLLNSTAARVLMVFALVLTVSLASARLVAEPDPESVESLVADLFGHDISVADEAARRLGERGKKARAAVPYLARTAREVATPHTRMQATIALGKIGGEEALEALLEISVNGETWTRYNAVAQLERFDDKHALERLWDEWKYGKNDFVRLRAYRGLAVKDEVGKPDPFFERVEDSDPEMRKFVVAQLGEFCRLEAVKYSIKKYDLPKDVCETKLEWVFTHDGEERVRRYAAESLARLDPKRLEKSLPKLDTDLKVLAEAALEEFTR